MKTTRLSTEKWGERIVLALCFIAVGSLIMIVFSPWRPLLDKSSSDKILDYLGRIGLVVMLMVTVALVRRSQRLKKYQPILVGLLILASAVSLDLIFGIYMIKHLGISDATPAGWAIQKLNESAVVISVILILNKLVGGSLSSLYIQRGNLKLGLVIGSIAFLIAAAGSIPMASLFKAQDLSLARITPWIPWLLIYVLANAAFEEIMFRGLFLRKLDPFFGKFMSNFLTAFVFTGLHGTVTYSADNTIFLAVTFPLALVWGYIMQRTDSVWGSILFHAGMDIPIMLGIFSNL